MAGKRVLSLKFSQVFAEDLELLRHEGWLNDRLIAFWFEVLETRFPDARLLMVDPSTVYWWLMEDQAEDLHEGMDAVELLQKQVVVIPVNDHTSKVAAGGSHWSLLLWVRGLCIVPSTEQPSPSPTAGDGASSSAPSSTSSATLCDVSFSSATASPETANVSQDQTMSVDTAGNKDLKGVDPRMLVDGKFWHLDSMRKEVSGPSGNGSKDNAEAIAQKLVEYVQAKRKEFGVVVAKPAEEVGLQSGPRPESRSRRRAASVQSVRRTTEAQCTQQANSSDCGVFLLLYVERLISGLRKIGTTQQEQGRGASGGSSSDTEMSGGDGGAAEGAVPTTSCCEACGCPHQGSKESSSSSCCAAKLVKLAGQVSTVDESLKLRTKMRVTVLREAEKRGLQF